MSVAGRSPVSTCSVGTGRIVFFLFACAVCQGNPSQGVKLSSLFLIKRLWRPLARLPPALLLATRKDPRLLRDTSPQQSSAALSVDHEAKKVFRNFADIRAEEPRGP